MAQKANKERQGEVEMEEQKLAKLLFDSAVSMKTRKENQEERKIWDSFLEKLNRRLAVSGCGGEAEAYTDCRPYAQACGYHRDYGYFYISCQDRETYTVTLLEAEEEMAANRFLEHIIDGRAYEWTVQNEGGKEASWPFCCRYDYRRQWFGKALEWLAPAVDWAFFTQCVERYISLLNRWFALPHWEYDYQLGHIIEISGSKENSDGRYVYRIEYDEMTDSSRISLKHPFDPDGSRGENREFRIDGAALDMKRKDGEVWLLMNRKEDNIDAYTPEGRFLWNIGDRLRRGGHYDDIGEAEEQL